MRRRRRERGAALFERSPVKKVTFNRKTADVFTAGGSDPHQSRRRRDRDADAAFQVACAALLVSDDLSHADGSRCRRRFATSSGAARRSCATAPNPPHIVRWVGDDRLLVSGADADAPPPRLRDKTIVQRTGQLMYELSTLYPDISGLQPEYGWAADYARSADGLPCIGAHRNFPHHLFAFGDASHSITGAYLASRILLRQHFDEMDPADEVFGFHR